MMSDRKTVTIPWPTVRPFDFEVTRDAVREAWDTFVVPDQESGGPQSIEMRVLMGILRAVYEGRPATEQEPDNG